MNVRSSYGSGFAISNDGQLLTARHVVDIAHGNPGLCSGIFGESYSSLLVNARVTVVKLVVTSHDGKQWSGIANSEMYGGKLCDNFGRLKLVWADDCCARVANIDGKNDLALVTITTPSLMPYLNLRKTWPQRGKKVAMTGIAWSDALGAKTINGSVLEPCVNDSVDDPLHVMGTYLVPLVKYGMSGGPVVSGDKWVDGIISRFAGNVSPGMLPYKYSAVVPGPYAAEWFEWVTGQASRPPSTTCPTQ